MLHHTLNPESFVHDSSTSVTRQKTIAVDCLFHEDCGLLRCQNNNKKALAKVASWLTVVRCFSAFSIYFIDSVMHQFRKLLLGNAL